MRRIAMFTTASAFALALSATPAFAQDKDPEDPNKEEEAAAEQEATGVDVNDPGDPTIIPSEADEAGEIVVTGSRIRRDTYSSISPLQVLETETARDTGAFDAAQILQRSESASGQQIDATFQGFVLDNGPGSATLNLRGLGANRTLLLLNGRRLAPAGVEGAPTSPSINLLPSSLIARYDLLTDGASSVYGSDAVAGVGNVILRNDIEGFELFASGSKNEESNAGDDYSVSVAFGDVFDRGFFGIGAEYDYRDAIRLRDRSYFNGCQTNYEIDQNGNIRRTGLADNAVVQRDSGGLVSVSESPCVVTGISGRIFIPFTRIGSVYFQPGQGNIPGLVDFSESSGAAGVPVDLNGDGIRDVDFQDVNTNAANLDETILSEQKRYSVMAYGEYELGGAMNITPYFEALFTRAEIRSDNTGTPQLFPSVPDLNQFNPCNIFTNPNGVNCRAADNALQRLVNPQFFLTNNPLGGNFALPVSPIVSIAGDRNNTNVEQEQYRGVLGIRGDLPMIGDSWTFDLSGVYSYSDGKSPRFGIREDKLALALGLDPTQDYNGDGIVDNNGDGIADDYDSDVDILSVLFGDPQYIGECNGAGLENPELAAPDLLEGCVPVNLFAPSVLSGGIGNFATQAERDYLFGERLLTTNYEQIVISAYATGDLFDLPAGPLAMVIGGEFRNDSINTEANFVSDNGLLFGFFRDLGTRGSAHIIEGFAELEIPVFDTDNFGDFDINVSGRITEQEFYGTAGTYSLKAGYRPIPELLFKASYGTSFRAPNLRENFLGGLSGFNGISDPCAVPNAAFVNGAYDATRDTREPEVLANCIREGRDPTSVGIDAEGLNVLQTASIEVLQTGTLELDPETSRSFTYGVSYGDTVGGFDINLGFNYYNIVLEDAVVGTTSQFVINECFLDDGGTRSRFCDNISYGPPGGGRSLINQVRNDFLNRDKELVSGLDFSANFGYEIPFGNDFLDLGLNLRANHLKERSTIFTLDDGTEDFDEDTGEFNFPRWTGNATGSVGYKDLTLTWQTRWTGSVEQNPDGIDPLSDAFGFGPDGERTGVIGDTCLGGGSRDADGTPNGIVEGDGIYCRDVGFADDYFIHTASMRYEFNDDLTLRLGVTNVFDTAPPLVDGSEVFSVNNVPVGAGTYDINGREFFGSINLRF